MLYHFEPYGICGLRDVGQLFVGRESAAREKAEVRIVFFYRRGRVLTRKRDCVEVFECDGFSFIVISGIVFSRFLFMGIPQTLKNMSELSLFAADIDCLITVVYITLCIEIC